MYTIGIQLEYNSIQSLVVRWWGSPEASHSSVFSFFLLHVSSSKQFTQLFSFQWSGGEGAWKHSTPLPQNRCLRVQVCSMLSKKKEGMMIYWSWIALTLIERLEIDQISCSELYWRCFFKHVREAATGTWESGKTSHPGKAFTDPSDSTLRMKTVMKTSSKLR